MMNRQSKAIPVWLFLGCFLIFSMVVIGGITRLTQSGLSMVEWDPVIGSLPPLNAEQWNEVFDKYKASPEYQKINYHFELDDFKSIFWWEYIHRALGRLIGLVFLIPFIYFWMTGKISRRLMPKLIVIFLLGALQGFVGWYMVKSGLVDKPYVSHYRLALHLSVAFGTFAYTFWVGLDEWLQYKKESTASPSLRRWTVVFLVVLTIQIIYGAFVAGLKAGYVYTTWPKMGDRWIADAVTAMEPFYRNFLEGLGGVQFIHRYIAYALIALAVYLWIKSRKVSATQAQRTGTNLLLGMTTIQIALGVFTLVYAVPVAMGVIHQVGAFFLLAIAVYLLHRLQGRPEAGQ